MVEKHKLGVSARPKSQDRNAPAPTVAGLSMQEAVTGLLLHKGRAIRASIARYLKARHQEVPGEEELFEFYTCLWPALMEELSSGSVRARGRLKGSLEFNWIEPELFGSCVPDVEASSFRHGEFEFHAVRFFQSPHCGLPRKGRPSTVRTRVAEGMRADLSEGRMTIEQLRGEKEEALAARHNASRDSCRHARTEVLSEIDRPTSADKKDIATDRS
jgi:hypothetical protein